MAENVTGQTWMDSENEEETTLKEYDTTIVLVCREIKRLQTITNKLLENKTGENDGKIVSNCQQIFHLNESMKELLTRRYERELNDDCFGIGKNK